MEMNVFSKPYYRFHFVSSSLSVNYHKWYGTSVTLPQRSNSLNWLILYEWSPPSSNNNVTLFRGASVTQYYYSIIYIWFFGMARAWHCFEKKLKYINEFWNEFSASPAVISNHLNVFELHDSRQSVCEISILHYISLLLLLSIANQWLTCRLNDFEFDWFKIRQ